MRFPSGLKATAQTSPVCPERVNTAREAWTARCKAFSASSVFAADTACSASKMLRSGSVSRLLIACAANSCERAVKASCSAWLAFNLAWRPRKSAAAARIAARMNAPIRNKARRLSCSALRASSCARCRSASASLRAASSSRWRCASRSAASFSAQALDCSKKARSRRFRSFAWALAHSKACASCIPRFNAPGSRCSRSHAWAAAVIWRCCRKLARFSSNHWRSRDHSRIRASWATSAVSAEVVIRRASTRAFRVVAVAALCAGASSGGGTSSVRVARRRVSAPASPSSVSCRKILRAIACSSGDRRAKVVSAVCVIAPRIPPASA